MVGMPVISVIIPCRNEISSIGLVLADLAAQIGTEPFEVIVADGGSDDGTRAFVEREALVEDRPFILRIIDNSKRIIPTALNLAVTAASGHYVIRIDGHCRLEPDYLGKIAAALKIPSQDVVGPQIRQIPGGSGLLAQAIAQLLSSPVGTGGTPSRGQLQVPRAVVHTVMSCYRREVWEQVGGYDERLLSNEDFDFDYRAGLMGFKVVSLPEPEFRLLARATVSGLFRQRWRYGWWKSVVARKFPASLQMRQVAPPVLLLGFMAVLLLAPLVAVIAASTYLLAGWIAGYFAARNAPLVTICVTVVCAPLILAVIHGAWALGFLVGLIANRTSVRSPALRVVA